MFGYGNYDLAVNTLADPSRRPRFCLRIAVQRGRRLCRQRGHMGHPVRHACPSSTRFMAYADRLSQREAYKRGKDEDNQLIAEMQAAGYATSGRRSA